MLLLFGMAFAIPLPQQADILRSARVSDLQGYYSASGVAIEDTPAISPFFACARAYEYRNIDVGGALMVDRIACSPNSYYGQAWRGIQLCNKGDPSGKLLIDETLSTMVSYTCSGGQ